MDEELIRRLERHLHGQLGEPELARSFAGVLSDLALTWKEDEPADRKADLIVAFSFGQRRDPNGNAAPDPVVAPRLKRLVHDFMEKLSGSRAYVQWEIAEAEGPPLGEGIAVVRPQLSAEDATAIYLSTEGVCRAVADATGGKNAAACVISHKHHARRCVETLRSFGFRAWAPFDELPDVYDPASSQPWCRSADQYLIHDLIARLRWRQRQRFRTASPASHDTR